MDSGLFALFLPITLGIMMMGLGLELTVRDFLRIGNYPKVIFIALFSQLIILVFIAYLICVVLQLNPLLSVGLMLLAASPGGPTANLFSYLFKGDIALNITLTALNSLLCIITLPFIVNLALLHFVNDASAPVSLPLDRVIQVFSITFIPVIIGMLIRGWIPRAAYHLRKPMRILSILFLAYLFIYAISRERHELINYFGEIGLAVALFCFASLFIGYLMPHLFGVSDRQIRACTFEIGIHNTAISLTIALSILDSTTIALPSAIYSIVMYVFAMAFGYFLMRQKDRFAAV